MAYAKLKVAELKKLLKEKGQSGAGEKEDLMRRLTQCDDGEKHTLPDGRNPTSLKAAEFRKLLAQRGLPCDLSINSRDELMQRLLDALKQEGGGGSGGSGGGGGASSSAGGGAGGATEGDEDSEALATRLAMQVLELSESGDPEGVLSVLGQTITRTTPFAQQRRAYLNLARIMHPDKLPRYQQATKAFQALVQAFETLTSPELPQPTAKAKAKAHTAISRSNQGCHKTKVFCPRCKSEWGTADSGVQPFDYNFMMQGLKTYCCALCLCEFGCMTAEHRCPLCHRAFEYHPQDYHRQVSCGNKKCSGSFGFWLHHVPPRVEDDLRAEAKQLQERRAKQREASAARAARSARKGAGAASEAERQRQAEALFCAALLDACPRCGFEPPPGTQRDELREHLHGCTDKRAHAAHREAVRVAEAARERKAARQDAQAEAQNLAVWQFLGGDDSQAWLLTDTQVRKQCEERGLSSEGTKEELLARMVQHRNEQKLLTDGRAGGAGPSGGPGGGPSGGGGGGGVSAASLPSNLHAMSLAQLRAVCAAHGVVPKSGASADELIRQLEAAAYADEPMLLLEEKRKPAAGRAKAGAGRGKRKKVDDDDDDDDDSGGDDEWVPEARAGGGRARGARKSYKEDVDDDDDDDD